MAAIIAIAAAMACAVLASCGGRQTADDSRPDSLAAALANVDDSVAVNSPYALKMIKDGMKNATDSLDYYDWYLRLMRYSVSHDVPDTTKLRWNSVYAFLSAREQTPRVRGMLGFLYNIKGSYYYKLHFAPAKESTPTTKPADNWRAATAKATCPTCAPTWATRTWRPTTCRAPRGGTGAHCSFLTR